MKLLSYPPVALVLLVASVADVDGVKKSTSKKGKKCVLPDLVGKYKLTYDFFTSSSGTYAFPDSEAYLLIEDPTGGTGALAVKYCFRTDVFKSRNLTAVQTGFGDDGRLPFVMTPYEDDETDTYDKYKFQGEYKCGEGGMFVGYAGYFDGNAFSSEATNDPTLALKSDGCPITSK
eukprot:CAMPEP_0198145452 /NCGR_PEP_ID=MMETSP1443-20131203/23582_1 /TAXON_ID=186043 /ORGANISM="Entomoneis sp., Strain CCMP2396" /LENGTH=174 /DNA_ID=CAMNT_0043809107 /DNA_START=74 /DNA_END=598 /DNA_ORIENTATION=-